ncbi:MAG: transposase zinc-binding domain-containing protein [Betaproteobacteria bacterium]|nr:transposase zinc-binding domain-containing protein [Betaproteobacteria bacterium]
MTPHRRLMSNTRFGATSNVASSPLALSRLLDACASCAERGHDFLVAFSCKARGVCPSCNTRRMVETAAHR